MQPATRQSDTQRHLQRIRTLATETMTQAQKIAALEDENGRLRRQLATVLHQQYPGHTALVVNGEMVVVNNTGSVYRRTEREITRPGESGREFVWTMDASVPTSPAALLDLETAGPAEMACVGGDEVGQ